MPLSTATFGAERDDADAGAGAAPAGLEAHTPIWKRGKGGDCVALQAPFTAQDRSITQPA